MLKKFVKSISKIYEDAIEPEVVGNNVSTIRGVDLAEPDEKEHVSKKILSKVFGVTDDDAEKMKIVKTSWTT